ncbi:MAG: hypothetical protein AAFY03_06300, partial [Pseudomonadota bacterium]
MLRALILTAALTGLSGFAAAEVETFAIAGDRDSVEQELERFRAALGKISRDNEDLGWHEETWDKVGAAFT